MTMFCKTRELPDCLQSALKSVGYAKADIQVIVREKESIGSPGGDGYRSFAVIVNMSTGERQTHWGSWGGPCIFAPNNRVDNDFNEYTIPPNGAVITGYTGGASGVTRASVTLSPANVLPMLQEVNHLTEEELNVLGIIRSYTSAYRKQLLTGKGAVIDRLVDGGYISRNKAGSISLTTKGKSAGENVRVY